ncbi:MAG: bifunctional enoyl-CoA hydratase/phosphate acetyltransferase [Azospirillaceae bacterium]|nr:bifunctional enoyl-CoA hydratase/phosphate acetyltransferase [Azospirillaceae bacterium]
MSSDVLENKTFDEIVIGETASVQRELRRDDIALFAVITGDENPTHLDEDYASSHGGKLVGHSMWSGALISGVLGNVLPGPGTIYRSQNLSFNGGVEVGDVLTVTVSVREKNPADKTVAFDCRVAKANGDAIAQGVAVVIAPSEKISRSREPLPEIQLNRHDGFLALQARCGSLEPIVTAVAFPCDDSSLRAALDAAAAGLIDPILVGPEATIRRVAEVHGLDLTNRRIVTAGHSVEAAFKAVELVRQGTAHSLMKGSLHTDELMHEIMVSATGLRTARRISHCFIMDVPSYVGPLIITDAAINIYPTLEEKRDICQNAIDLALALGMEPRVAILSAVETINPKILSTVDAAALCKMAERGQIIGGILDGPLAMDNAISRDAAKIKKISSPVAGKANILLVPNLEAGNMVAKELSFLAGADAAGIVLGARVPVILTSRADSVRSRMASCAVAVLYAHYLQNNLDQLAGH